MESKKELEHVSLSKTDSPSSLKVGELLVKEFFATGEDVKKALDIQEREKEYLNLPLGKILVDMNLLSEDDLEQALTHPNLRKNIGSLAVDKGLITKNDLESALKNKKLTQSIGDFLVNKGLLTPNDIGNLLKEQINSPKIGQILIDLKIITENNLKEVLKKQNSPRAIGEILCDLKIITPQDLHYVLNKYNKQIEIEETLLKLRLLDKQQLQSAKQEAEKTSKTLVDVLLTNKHITSEQLQSAQANKLNLPFEYLNNFEYNENDKRTLSGLIQQKYAEKNFILPLSLSNKILKIAIFQPETLNLSNELKKLYPGLEISFVFITKEKFEELFEILFSKKLSSDLMQNMEFNKNEEIDFMEINLDENINQTKNISPEYGAQDIEAEELVNFIVKYGILNKASDIHIEQDRKEAKLRYRIDGVLQDINVGWIEKKLPGKINSIISRIKIMSNLDIAEKRLPQDGVFRTNYYDKATNQKLDLDFRVATCRGIVGENLTIRILDSRQASIGLENLNHSPHVLNPFKRLLKSSAGIILVSGPTGSGKSSSLYGALRYVYNPGLKIITAEDPIEYSFPGIMQTQINQKINLSFSRLLRSFLRLDPDIMLIGEIRDKETATISFDAAQTGHLLLATIHTNDSVSAVSRLADLGVDYKQISSCLLAVLAQRLIRKICPFCKKEYVPEDDELGPLFNSYPSHLKFYKGEGCEACNFSGYKGRILISEIFTINREVGNALIKGLNDIEIKKIAVETGMKTMLDDGLLKLNDTTLSELTRVIPEDMIQAFKFRSTAQQDADIMFKNISYGGSRTNNASRGFKITDPETENNIIEEMFQNYSNLNSGNNSTKEYFPLFKDFIVDSFIKICKQYDCSNVRFSINAGNGKADISALPE